MGSLVTAITDAISGVFTAIIEAFSGVGSLIFTIGESGAITGVTPFGYIFALTLGIPLATWLVSKGLSLLKIGKSK